MAAAGIRENLTLTLPQVQQIFNGTGFGLTSFARIVRTEDDAFAFVIHTGLVPLEPGQCECGRVKRLTRRQDRVNAHNRGYLWICSRANDGLPACRRERCVLHGTIFEDAKAPLTTILDLMVHWFFKSPVSMAAGQEDVSKKCAIHYYELFREVCVEVVLQIDDTAIGGPGLTVELDESHIYTRKYHRGRNIALGHRQQWMFGGICRETKEVFMCLVPNRSGQTLIPIINRRVVAGSIIMTDQAAVYNMLRRPQHGLWDHFTVNHSQNFVNPNDPTVYTNTLETTWRWAKYIIKPQGDCEQYVTEYVYRKHHIHVDTDAERKQMGLKFRIFINHVIAAFPGPFAPA